MVIKTTKRFDSDLLNNRALIDEFIDAFSAYKSKPNKEHFEFGKDLPYHSYLIDNKLILMHVHLVPTNIDDLELWSDVFYENCSIKDNRKRKAKTSNTCLIYIENDKGEYLLIKIFREPNAHKYCYSQSIMKPIQEIAEDFYCLGVISG